MGIVVAQTEAHRFINWLEKYNHYSNYKHIGQAMLSWLTADGGASRLGYDYTNFLQMVIAVIVIAKGTLRVRISDGKYYDLNLPTSFEGWLPDRDDFQIAVDEEKAHRAENDG